MSASITCLEQWIRAKTAKVVARRARSKMKKVKTRKVVPKEGKHSLRVAKESGRMRTLEATIHSRNPRELPGLTPPCAHSETSVSFSFEMVSAR